MIQGEYLADAVCQRQVSRLEVYNKAVRLSIMTDDTVMEIENWKSVSQPLVWKDLTPPVIYTVPYWTTANCVQLILTFDVRHT